MSATIPTTPGSTTKTSAADTITPSSSQTLISRSTSKNDRLGVGHGHPQIGSRSRAGSRDFFGSRTRATAVFILVIIVIVCVICLPIYIASIDRTGSAADGKVTSSSLNQGRRPAPSGRFVLPVMPQSDWTPQCDAQSASDAVQLDCHPESGVDETRCRQRGCCWTVKRSGNFEVKLDSVRDRPIITNRRKTKSLPCIYPRNFGYVVSGPEEQFTDGWEMPLTRLHGPSRYGDDVHFLKVRVDMQTPTRLRIKFYNPHPEHEDGLAEPSSDPLIPQEKVDLSKLPRRRPKLYAVSYHRGSVPFGLQVRRVDTGTVIFNTSMSGLIIASQFLQIAIRLPSSNIYGLGPLMPTTEDRSRNFSSWPTWSLFASHTQENHNGKIHGGHPLYMCLENDGRAHAVLLHTSYPVDMQLQSTPHMTYRALGGSLDFYIFLGPTPEDVVKQYTEAVGRPFLPPYWALGFQISHVGVKDIATVKESLRDLQKNNIPYDVVSLGSEYMNNGIDFTINYRNFPNLLIFTDQLEREARHLDLDLDPAVSHEQPWGTYLSYDEGLRYGVFVNDSLDTAQVTGKTSSGESVFVDFGSPEVDKWWTRNLRRLQSMVRFKSLSLVENYPSNWRNDTSDVCLRDNFNHPPYVPRALANSRLFWHTICMDGIQWQGKRKVRHYSIHNTYGHQMAKVTYKALLDKLVQNGGRPMLVSQSTFTGSGKYVGFWAMDNARTWSYLEKSIDSMLSYNIYGMPLVGSPICGMDVPLVEDRELCMRWLQLGAFYPLARMVHDPLFCDKDFGRVARNAITDRYTLLPYLYHLFYKATTEGGTVARPLFHEFYWDKNTYNITTQFMWGPSLMIVPVLSKGARVVDVYFPYGIWYIYQTGGRLESSGSWVTVEAPLDRTNLFIRGGAIVPTQTAGLTTAQSRKNNFHLIVALDENNTASGQLFWDDGVSQDTLVNNEYVLVNFTVEQNKLTVSGSAMKPLLPSSLISTYFTSVDIFGFPYLPEKMSILGTSGVLSTARQLTWDPLGKVAKVREVILPFTEKVEIVWFWTV